MKMRALALIAAVVAVATVAAADKPQEQGFSFRTAVDLINVTVTVTDSNGRFVSGLRKDDFIVYEDGKPQTITHFDSERVPVSLGLVLDTSGSMAGEKMETARSAVERFLHRLLDESDEVFFYQFASNATLVQDWTTDRDTVSRAVSRVQARGGTALYDAAAEAVPLAQSGTQRKKAVVIISDGNDTSSQVDAADLQQLIRETEVLVYAIGIDSEGGSRSRPSNQQARRQPARVPVPSPFPGRKPPVVQAQPQPRPTASRASRGEDSVDEDTLRSITDDSGGRTEIIRDARDLGPATDGIADELSRQYFIGYSSTTPKDGRWHSIEVRLKRGSHHVRARKGYVAG